MEDDCLEKVMWNVLQKFGLDEKKLAVFDVSESGVIAVQICDHLGVICEGLHVDIVADGCKQFQRRSLTRSVCVETSNKIHSRLEVFCTKVSCLQIPVQVLVMLKALGLSMNFGCRSVRDRESGEIKPWQNKNMRPH